MQAAQPGAEVEPLCPHATMCGGCTFQERAYQDQVAAKGTVLHQVWQEAEWLADDALVQELTVVPSPDAYQYRTRMDYVATKGRFGLRMPGRWNFIVELETCHLIPPAAFACVLLLWQRACALGMPDYNLRTHEGFLRYLVVRRSPQDTLLIAAVTAEGPYAEAMEELATLALQQPGVEGFHWLVNDTLTDLSFAPVFRYWGAETLPMQVGSVQVRIGPNTFFQNNVHLLPALLAAVEEAVTARAGDSLNADSDTGMQVADLYGGVGLIALHLADLVGHVVIVESHQESAELARLNVAENQANNVAVVAEDVADFLRSQSRGCFDCVVVDPPRTGLGEAVCAELLRLAPARVVYVSCNALTQFADIRQLADAYRLVHLQGYDMFPQTPHVEMLAVLERV